MFSEVADFSGIIIILTIYLKKIKNANFRTRKHLDMEVLSSALCGSDVEAASSASMGGCCTALRIHEGSHGEESSSNTNPDVLGAGVCSWFSFHR